MIKIATYRIANRRARRRYMAGYSCSSRLSNAGLCGSNPFLGTAKARHVVLMPLSCCIAVRGDERGGEEIIDRDYPGMTLRLSIEWIAA